MRASDVMPGGQDIVVDLMPFLRVGNVARSIEFYEALGFGRSQRRRVQCQSVPDRGGGAELMTKPRSPGLGASTFAIDMVARRFGERRLGDYFAEHADALRIR